MKTLMLDIETSPNLAHVWSLWNQNIGINQLRESTEMLCFAAKWFDKPKTMFWSQYHDGRDVMVQKAHGLLDEADVVMHYNGTKFDIPHLNREFLLAGLTPPAPYEQIDLLKTVRKSFRFPSNKLAYVSDALGLEGKVTHSGHDLWVRCLAGDAKAWHTMRKYNKRDVTLLEDLYHKVLPWISDHPTVGLYDGEESSCPSCGSWVLERRGFTYTKVSKYQRFRCTECGKWSRATARDGHVSVAPITV